MEGDGNGSDVARQIDDVKFVNPVRERQADVAWGIEHRKSRARIGDELERFLSQPHG
jgi:hypothetical protein